jgi:hypothetical protein
MIWNLICREKQLRFQLFMAEMHCNNTKNIQLQLFLLKIIRFCGQMETVNFEDTI